MRIELDLPDWVDERHIRIYAGIELAAIKRSHEDFWRVKDVRCQQCGECCTNIKNHVLPTNNGVCIYLVDEPGTGRKKCDIALHRPRHCGDDPPSCEHITHNIVKCQAHTTPI